VNTGGPAPVFDAVIFDLDGTVVDSVELIVLSFQHAMREVLGREVNREEAVRNVGRPLRDQMVEIDPMRADELVRVYREFNHREHDRLLHLYDGMLDLLHRLGTAGVKLGLVTSKSRSTTQMAFDLTGIEPYFDQTICSDEAPRNKPEPDPILLCLRLLEVEPERAAYVGDSPFDMQAARAARVRAVGVSWGVFPEEALQAERADVVVSTIEELAGVLGI
jgi:pyrophosphatase PpaX